MWRSVEYLLFSALPLGAPLLTLLSPQPSRPVLVVAAPGSDSARTVELISRAEGAVLRGTAIPWIAVAVSPRSDFPVRLRQAGAWMILDAALVSGCGNTDPN